VGGMKEGGQGGRKRGGTDSADYVDYCYEGVPYYSRTLSEPEP
jgi:hypothetical protein